MSNITDARLTSVKVEVPSLVATIAYNDTNMKSAGANNYFVFPGLLTTSAQSRTLYLVNQFNVDVTSFGFYVVDSRLPIQPTAGTAFNLFGDGYTDANGVKASGIGVYHSKKHPELSAYGDTLALYLGVGATMPTSGSFTIYLAQGLGA